MKTKHQAARRFFATGMVRVSCKIFGLIRPLLLTLAVFALPPANALADTVTLSPKDDAYVRGGAHAATNYGTDIDIEVKYSTTSDLRRQGYIKFDTYDIRGTVASAILKVSCTVAGTTGETSIVTDIVGSDSDWLESTIDWNNKPAVGASLGSIICTKPGFTVREIDIADYVASEKSAGRHMINLSFDNPGPVTVQYTRIRSKESALVPELIISYTPTTPAAPANLVADAGNAAVALTWDPVVDATHYKVKRSTSAGGPYTELATTLRDSSYTDNGVTPGTTYHYVASAVNNASHSLESSNSAEASDTVRLLAPQLNLTNHNGKVRLFWSKSEHATGYNVKRSTSSGGPYETIVSDEPDTRYTDSSVTNGVTYYYVVSALTSSTESSNSRKCAAKASARAAPVALIAVAGDASVSLSWEAASGATGYTIKRGTSQCGPYNTTVATGVTDTSYVDTTVTNGTLYYYVAIAEHPNGTSGFSNAARVIPVSGVSAGSAHWPVSNSTSANADASRLRFAYGPRDTGSYDFHAGIDLVDASGDPTTKNCGATPTRVHAVLGGTVTQLVHWDGVSLGSGNRVLINHGDQKWTAYLHLAEFAANLFVGKTVQAGNFIGYMGRTGASNCHLHLTYMVGLTSEGINELKSRNPLEIMPITQPVSVDLSASFRTDGSNTVDVMLPAHKQTVRWVILKGTDSGGATQTRIADYYDIAGAGVEPRDNRSQFGIHFTAAVPDDAYPAGGGTLRWTFKPSPVTAFTLNRIILKDHNGNTLLDQTKP